MNYSTAEIDARDTRKHLRKGVRLRAMWSVACPQTLHLEHGTAYCYNKVWQADNQDGLLNLQRLIGTGLNRRSREIVARNANILRTNRIGRNSK